MRALRYVSKDLKNEKDFLLAAVISHGDYLQHASEDIKADKEVMLAVVTYSKAACAPTWIASPSRAIPCSISSSRGYVAVGVD